MTYQLSIKSDDFELNEVIVEFICQNDPKFSDRLVWANSADLGKNAPSCHFTQKTCFFNVMFSGPLVL